MPLPTSKLSTRFRRSSSGVRVSERHSS
jgi:hypothetical protein